MNEKVELIKKIIKKRPNLEPLKFRLLIETIVKEGDPEVINFVSTLALETSLPHDLRSDLIRVMGYSQVTQFLFPLKKIAEDDPDIGLRREAIIAISKFNDRKAYNTLNMLLKKIENKNLLTMVQGIVEKMKQNNPILSLLPRFLKGEKDPKSSNIAKEILKKILPKEEVKIFYQYLSSKDSMVSEGAFEIITSIGDSESNTYLFDYLKNVYSKFKVNIVEKERFLGIVETYLSYVSRTRIRFSLKEENDFLLLLSKEFEDDVSSLEFVAPLLLYSNEKSVREKAYEYFKNMFELRRRIAEHLGIEKDDIEFMKNNFKSVDPEIRKIFIHKLLELGDSYKELFDVYKTSQLEIRGEIVREANCEFLEKIKDLLEEDIKDNRSFFRKEFFLTIHRRGCLNFKDLLLNISDEVLSGDSIKEYINALISITPVEGIIKFLSFYNEKPETRRRLKDNFNLIERTLLTKPFGFYPEKLNKNLKNFNKSIEVGYQKFSVLLNSSIVPVDVETLSIETEFFGMALKKDSFNLDKGEILKASEESKNNHLIVRRIIENTKKIENYVENRDIFDRDEMVNLIGEPISFFNEAEKIFSPRIKDKTEKKAEYKIREYLEFLRERPFFAVYFKDIENLKNNTSVVSLIEEIENSERKLNVFIGEIGSSLRNSIFEFLLNIFKDFVLSDSLENSDLAVSTSEEVARIEASAFKKKPTIVIVKNPEETRKIKDYSVSFVVCPFDFIRFYSTLSKELQKWVK